MKKIPSSTLVYSTGIGRIKPPKEKETSGQKSRDPSDGVIRIHRETKGRGGKGVCIITGFVLNEKEMETLAKKIKQHCGTGGTVKNHTIEIQGEQREKIKSVLEAQGYTVKLAGG